MAFLRQQYAKVICDYVKLLGGKPFLADCNTLYSATANCRNAGKIKVFGHKI